MIRFDANDFKDRETFYKLLNEKCIFDYYVENLDALYDELVVKDNEIEIINFHMIFENLGEYGQRVVQVFVDSVKDYDSKVSLINWYDIY